MYWTIKPRIRAAPPVDEIWTIKLIYDSDHPNSRCFSGSIKPYPVNPSVDALIARAARHGRNYVPHLLPDSYKNRYLCTRSPSDFEAGDLCDSAATVFGWCVEWALQYTIGLMDGAVWSGFCEHAW